MYVGVSGVPEIPGPHAEPSSRQRVVLDHLVELVRSADRRGTVADSDPRRGDDRTPAVPVSPPLVEPVSGTWMYDTTNDDNWMPLTVDNASLPTAGRPLVPLVSLLSPDVRATVECGAIFRDPSPELLERVLDAPRAFGVVDGEYPGLVCRAVDSGIVSLSALPPAVVCGIFGVRKSDLLARLILDARAVNLLFRPIEPAVELPLPTLIAELLVEVDRIYVGKLDLADYYHTLRLPECLRGLAGLRPVRVGDLRACLRRNSGDRSESVLASVSSLGDDDLVWPHCESLPMGLRDAVALAQDAHVSLLKKEFTEYDFDVNSVVTDRGQALVLRSTSSVYLLVYIDDFNVIGADPELVNSILDRAKRAYVAAGLTSKESKEVRASRDQVATTVLGISVESRGVLCPDPDKLQRVIARTLDLIWTSRCTGRALSRVVGSWTWLMLIRRPLLSVFASVYDFMESSAHRPSWLPSSVISELRAAIALSPLLQVDMKMAVNPTVIASDASTTGGGVSYLSTQDGSAVREALAVGIHETRGWYTRLVPDDSAPVSKPLAESMPDSLRALVSDIGLWKTAIAVKWRRPSHINALEMSALCLALRWLSRSVRHYGSRVLALVDNMSVVGAIAKGRSSSRALLFYCRKVCALVSSMGLRLSVAWVGTKYQPADMPSRL